MSRSFDDIVCEGARKTVWILRGGKEENEKMRKCNNPEELQVCLNQRRMVEMDR
jgi:hypothetical protein